MMRAVVFAAVVLLAPSIGGCALLPHVSGVGSARAEVLPGSLEPIHAAVIARDQAMFRVSSNGCTAKADLTPVVRRADGVQTITLRRIHEDRCMRPIRDGIEVRWSFEELGLAPGARVQVDNPYQMPVG